MIKMYWGFWGTSRDKIHSPYPVIDTCLLSIKYNTKNDDGTLGSTVGNARLGLWWLIQGKDIIELLVFLQKI